MRAGAQPGQRGAGTPRAGSAGVVRPAGFSASPSAKPKRRTDHIDT